MNFLPAKRLICLHTQMSISDCVRALQNATDPFVWTIFSLSGYQGSRPVLGEMKGLSFVLQKRRYYKNGGAPFLFGTFHSENGGTRLDGYFDCHPWARVAFRAMNVLFLISCVPLFFASLAQAFGLHKTMQGNLWVGLVVPPILLLSGFLIPRIGYWLGKREERYLTTFLEHLLHVRPCAFPSSIATNKQQMAE